LHDAGDADKKAREPWPLKNLVD